MNDQKVTEIVGSDRWEELSPSLRPDISPIAYGLSWLANRNMNPKGVTLASFEIRFILVGGTAPGSVPSTFHGIPPLQKIAVVDPERADRNALLLDTRLALRDPMTAAVELVGLKANGGD